MSTPCKDVEKGNTSSCQVEVLINGIPITGLKLIRKHEKGKPDQLTLTGHTIVQLNAGDVIHVRLLPTNGKYQVAPQHARLTMKMEPWF